MVIQLGFCGALGKVGQEFLQHFSENDYNDLNLSIILIEKKNSDYEKLCKRFSILSKVKVLTPDLALEDFDSDFDVLLDYSNPNATIQRCSECSVLGKPFITGTTGFTKQDIEKLIEFSKTIPVIISQNFAWGINFIFTILKNVVKLIPDEYFVELYESHGPNKVDAPSGTAKRIIEILKDGKFIKNVFVNNFNIPMKSSDLQIFVSRNSQNTNEHNIKIRGHYEEVTILHKTFSKKIYIEPSLKAVKYSLTLHPGLYYFENIFEHLSNVTL